MFLPLAVDDACFTVCVQALADDFLEGSLSLDSFFERFLLLRSLAHKRRVQIEKLQEILRQRDKSNPTAMTSTAGVAPNPVATAASWNLPTTTVTTTNLPQLNSNPPSSSYQNSSQSASSSAVGASGLPYSPYPASPPNPPAVVAAAGPIPNNPPPQFTPYPSSGSSFTSAAGYSGPRPAFGPPCSVTCPYPTQHPFPVPHPGSAFGQYTPSHPPAGGPAPYPASYSYGGYSYPAAPAYSSSQSPTGKPMYRAGYGVPQPYS